MQFKGVFGVLNRRCAYILRSLVSANFTLSKPRVGWWVQTMSATNEASGHGGHSVPAGVQPQPADDRSQASASGSGPGSALPEIGHNQKHVTESTVTEDTSQTDITDTSSAMPEKSSHNDSSSGQGAGGLSRRARKRVRIIVCVR